MSNFPVHLDETRRIKMKYRLRSDFIWGKIMKSFQIVFTLELLQFNACLRVIHGNGSMRIKYAKL